MFFRKDQKGFTLIEVMLVVIIIGIIAIIALPKLLVTKVTASKKSCISNQQAIRTALEQYEFETGAYPAVGADGGLAVDELVAEGYVRDSGDTTGVHLSRVCPAGATYTYVAATGSFICPYNDGGSPPVTHTAP